MLLLTLTGTKGPGTTTGCLLGAMILSTHRDICCSQICSLFMLLLHFVQIGLSALLARGAAGFPSSPCERLVQQIIYLLVILPRRVELLSAEDFKLVQGALDLMLLLAIV